MKHELLRYEADGLAMESHFYAGDDSGRRPGILVFPEIFGLGEHAKNRADRLAGLGYAVLACDIHGEGRLVHDLAEVQALMAPVRNDPERVRARARGGLKALLARPEVDPTKIAAIGYCFGGSVAFELARSGADILGAVGFHSGLVTKDPDDAKNIKGKILACIGADDPGVPASQRTAFEEEMRAANVRWQLNVYGGVVHSFTNPEADKMGRPEMARYDAIADHRSWSEMRSFFDEIFITE